MSRGGARSEAEGSERTCIVTRRAGAPETMIRFVRAPDGTVTPDIRARLPGRGVWVGARAALVSEATKKRMFARGLKEQTLTPPDLADSVDRLLEADCLQMLALVNKAGGVICGFNKAAEALTENRIAALLEARDGGPDGKRKLRQSARRAGYGEAPMIGLFSSSQLDLALGRTNVIHAALVAGGPAENFLVRCRRLAAYRDTGLDGETSTDGTEFIGPDEAQDWKLDE